MRNKTKAFAASVLAAGFAAGLFSTQFITVDAAGNTIRVGEDAATINEALAVAQEGDTVYIPAGVYHEQLNIDKNNISLVGEEGTILDAYVPDETEEEKANPRKNDILPTADKFAMINVCASGVTVSNIEMEHLYLDSANPDVAPMGIKVNPGLSDINISKCKIHDMGCNYNTEDGDTTGKVLDEGFNSHGILVQGMYKENEGINNVTIEGCEIYNLRLGQSESLVVNGNVDNFKIMNNHVHDNDNIGIDAIGFEKTVNINDGGETLKDGVTLEDAMRDRARGGVISGNIVENISSTGNPAYPYDEENPRPAGTDYREASADGIYVDGGCDITIANNFVRNCDIGVEIASERVIQKDKSFDFSVTGIKVTNNTLYENNGQAGICIGGYEEEREIVYGCEFTNNTVYNSENVCLKVQHTADADNLKSGDYPANVFEKNLFITDGKARAYDEAFEESKYSEGNTFTDNMTNDKKFKTEGVGQFKLEGIDVSDMSANVSSPDDLAGYGANGTEQNLVDTDKPDVEDVDDENIDDENIDDENIDDENIDNENIDDENIDDENIDDENIDDENIDDENIDDKDVEDENVDDEDVEDEDDGDDDEHHHHHHHRNHCRSFDKHSCRH